MIQKTMLTVLKKLLEKNKNLYELEKRRNDGD